MMRVVLLALLITSCAHRHDVLNEFPQFDSSWWYASNRCPDGAHRATLEREGSDELWGCVLADGTRHGPFAWVDVTDGPFYVGSYEHERLAESYFDASEGCSYPRAIGRDGRLTVFVDGQADYVAEQSLGCPDGELQQFRDSGALAFRSLYDNGVEVGPRVPFLHGEPQPVVCILGAEAYCPANVNRWTKPSAATDDCRKFREYAIQRGDWPRKEQSTCERRALSDEEQLAHRAIGFYEYVIASLVIEHARLPSEAELRNAMTEHTEYAIDPWGQPYAYQAAGRDHVRSAGPDRVMNTEDDITSSSVSKDEVCPRQTAAQAQ